MSFQLLDRVKIRSMEGPYGIINTYGTIIGMKQKYVPGSDSICICKYQVELDPPSTLTYNGFSITKCRTFKLTMMFDGSDLENINK